MKPLHARILWAAIVALAACASADNGDSATANNADSSTTAGGTSTAGSTNTASTLTAASSGGDLGTGDADTTAAHDTGAADTASSDGDTGEPGSPCDDPALVWHSGNKTNYESYPDPGSKECTEFNGCDYLGQFAECENTMPERWVMAHDIVAVFPLADLGLHRLCLRSGDARIVVTAIDTCSDSDCDGCCTENLGAAEALIDLEKYTNERFGIEDGAIEWADLGPGDPSFDGCN
jgi:hypothetical protein